MLNVKHVEPIERTPYVPVKLFNVNLYEVKEEWKIFKFFLKIIVEKSGAHSKVYFIGSTKLASSQVGRVSFLSRSN